MHINYYRLLIIFVSLYCIYGCATFRQYPPLEKKLFSWQIPKNQVETIKNTILSDGYKRISNDNYPYMGAIVTQYAKEISTTKIKSRVQIMLNFKDTCISNVYYGKFDTGIVKEDTCTTETAYYRNLGISIFNLDNNDIPEINDEVNRIEEILYKKLLEVAGEKNVVRGKRE